MKRHVERKMLNYWLLMIPQDKGLKECEREMQVLKGCIMQYKKRRGCKMKINRRVVRAWQWSE